MTDIVERLRNYRVWNRRYQHYEAVGLTLEAAEEIERLTEELRHAEHKLANIIRTG